MGAGVATVVTLSAAGAAVGAAVDDDVASGIVMLIFPKASVRLFNMLELIAPSSKSTKDVKFDRSKLNKPRRGLSTEAKVPFMRLLIEPETPPAEPRESVMDGTESVTDEATHPAEPPDDAKEVRLEANDDDELGPRLEGPKRAASS